MRPSLLLSAILCLFLLAGCRDDNPETAPVSVSDLEVVLNPSGFAPLTALLRFRTSDDVQVGLRIIGRNGPDSDIFQVFPELGREFAIPVLGLYGNYANEIELTFTDETAAFRGVQTVTINTPPLIADLPQVTVDTYLPGELVPGLHFVNYFGHAGRARPQRALFFDNFGAIRWYLDYSSHPVLNNLFYDNGMVPLANGNLVFGDGSTGTLYEIDRFGEILNTWSLQGYGFHHHVIEKPNGNFLVTVNDYSKPTVEDVILEIDRLTGEIVNTWDLNESLDNRRRAWPTDIANLEVDWFHANGLAYDADDDAILVSGRTQGTVKLSADNEVIWILAPHRGWGTAGEGTDLSTKLLQPLDAGGVPITDAAVREGTSNHPDFEWAWYQHSPILLPNGNVMVFDNGDNRNYVPTGFDSPSAYSRAVEYAIDEENGTIQQVWSYGKDRGQETYSRIVSKVSHLGTSDHVLFTPGAVRFQGNNYGKVIEIDRAADRTVFEATITPPTSVFNITFHNVLRVPLYPAP